MELVGDDGTFLCDIDVHPARTAWADAAHEVADAIRAFRRQGYVPGRAWAWRAYVVTHDDRRLPVHMHIGSITAVPHDAHRVVVEWTPAYGR